MRNAMTETCRPELPEADRESMIAEIVSVMEPDAMALSSHIRSACAGDTGYDHARAGNLLAALTACWTQIDRLDRSK